MQVYAKSATHIQMRNGGPFGSFNLIKIVLWTFLLGSSFGKNSLTLLDPYVVNQVNDVPIILVSSKNLCDTYRTTALLHGRSSGTERADDIL